MYLSTWSIVLDPNPDADDISVTTSTAIVVQKLIDILYKYDITNDLMYHTVP